MKLYFAPGTAALVVMIALEEAGLKYEPIRVDFKANEQRGEAYLRLNPKGRVPALVTDEGTLTETPAILAYIAQIAPKAKLAPSDPYHFAKVQEFNTYLCSTVHVAHAHKMRGSRWADDPAAHESMKAKVTENVAGCFALIEGWVKGPWVMGEAYSIADPYLYVLTSWSEGDGVNRANYPKVAAHFEKMRARPAVQRALKIQAG